MATKTACLLPGSVAAAALSPASDMGVLEQVKIKMFNVDDSAASSVGERWSVRYAGHVMGGIVRRS
jgi:hypothetical protein